MYSMTQFQKMLNIMKKEFFIEFGPIFLKNSIWSKKKPVPKIGDMNTPWIRSENFTNFGQISKVGEIFQ